MELNEVNSQLAKLMTFNKVSPSVAGGKEVFAELLNRTEPKDKSAQAPDNKDIKNIKSDNREDDKYSDKKVNPKKNDNKNKIADRKNNVASDVSVKQSPASDKMQPVDNSKDVKPSVVDTDSSGDDVSNVENSTPIVDAVLEEAPKLEAEAIPLDVLALMGAINVINPQTNEMTQTTGAQLAALLAGRGDVQAIQLPIDDSAQPTLQLVPVEAPENVVATPAETKIDLSQFQPLEDGDNLNVDLNILPQNQEKNKADVLKNANIKASSDNMVDEKIGEQASKIADVISENDKLKIKVSVHEEKIAQLGSKDLLVDTKSVDDAITSVSAKPATVAAKANVEAISQTPQANVANPNNQNINVVPLYNATATAPLESNVVAAPALAEINSTTLATAVAPGGEFVKAAKAEAADSQTSFRDVYKGLNKEVVDQVKVNITKSAVKGVDKIDISLKPEDLGKIEIKMQIGKDGKLQAHIISSRPETMEALQKEIQSLEKAFNDAGFQTDEGSLSFSFREGGQANQNQERENGLRNFIGDVFEREANNDVLNTDAFQNQSWDGKSGLNIRV